MCRHTAIDVRILENIETLHVDFVLVLEQG